MRRSDSTEGRPKSTYALKVTVKDSHGLAGAVATITVIVTA